MFAGNSQTLHNKGHLVLSVTAINMFNCNSETISLIAESSRNTQIYLSINII